MPGPLSIASIALRMLSFLRGGQRPWRKVKVSVGHGFLVYGFTPDGLGEQAIAAHATNDAAQPLVIESAGLTFDSGATVLPPPLLMRMFPHRLAQGDKQSVWFSIDELVQRLKENEDLGLPKYAWFRDSAGREYRSKIPQPMRETVGNLLAASGSGDRGEVR